MSDLEKPTHAEGVNVWLENGEEMIPLTSPFSIGRSSKSSHTIPGSDISREHSLFQYSHTEKRWIVTDLGSTNGTYLNNKRIITPHNLAPGDSIRIADHQFHFRSEEVSEESDPPTGTTQPTQAIDPVTLVTIDSLECFLLVADVSGSTRLSQTMPQSELSAKIRMWAKECETLINESGGIVNEFMGDGLLAFWRYERTQHETIADLLLSFQEMTSESGLDFRVILHHGEVGIGGGVSSGIEKLGGQELNYIFKMEKTAGISGAKVSITEAAKEKLQRRVKTRDLGQFQVDGFAGTQKLYAPVFSEEEDN